MKFKMMPYPIWHVLVMHCLSVQNNFLPVRFNHFLSAYSISLYENLDLYN